jgi:hypothetical protein
MAAITDLSTESVMITVVISRFVGHGPVDKWPQITNALT